MTKTAPRDADPQSKRNRAMSRFQVVEAPAKPRIVPSHRTIGCKIWILLLLLGGTTLVTYGAAYEKQWEFKKLYISVGILIFMCIALFFSFVIFDKKEMQQYMLYMLYPWMCLSCLLLAALIFAMAEKFISVYYFVIMLIPILAIGFYTFGEIFLYVERQRLRPILLRERLQERVPLQVLQFEYDDGEFINWTETNVIHDDREAHNAKVTCASLRPSPRPRSVPNNCFYHTAIVHAPPSMDDDTDLPLDSADVTSASLRLNHTSVSELPPAVSSPSYDSLAPSPRTMPHAFAASDLPIFPGYGDLHDSYSSLGAASAGDGTALPLSDITNDIAEIDISKDEAEQPEPSCNSCKTHIFDRNTKYHPLKPSKQNCYKYQ